MATTFVWTVTQMKTLQQPDPNYVVDASWRLTGIDGTYSAWVEGSNTFSTTQSSPFVPYDQLTNDIVIGWVKAQLGPDNIASSELTVQGSINSQKNPPISPQLTSLPWA